MKYLKTFESIDKPYLSIGEDIFCLGLYGDEDDGDYYLDKWVDFSKNELSEIERILGEKVTLIEYFSSGKKLFIA